MNDYQQQLKAVSDQLETFITRLDKLDENKVRGGNLMRDLAIALPIGVLIGTGFVQEFPHATQAIRQEVWGDRASPVFPRASELGQYAGSGAWRDEQ